MENIVEILRVLSDMQIFSSDDCRLGRIIEEVCDEELSCAELELVSAAANSAASYHKFEALLNAKGIRRTK